MIYQKNTVSGSIIPPHPPKKNKTKHPYTILPTISPPKKTLQTSHRLSDPGPFFWPNRPSSSSLPSSPSSVLPLVPPPLAPPRGVAPHWAHSAPKHRGPQPAAPAADLQGKSGSRAVLPRWSGRHGSLRVFSTTKVVRKWFGIHKNLRWRYTSYIFWIFSKGKFKKATQSLVLGFWNVVAFVDIYLHVCMYIIKFMHIYILYIYKTSIQLVAKPLGYLFFLYSGRSINHLQVLGWSSKYRLGKLEKRGSWWRLLFSTGVITVDGSEIETTTSYLYETLWKTWIFSISTGAGFLPSTVWVIILPTPSTLRFGRFRCSLAPKLVRK